MSNAKNTSPDGELTPGMRQYMQAKRTLPDDTLLMFRMGDFYEMFFEDARIAAPLMDVVLTTRAGAPLCGIPYRAVRQYLPRILAGGYKVALADQVEDPKQAKGLVKRDITEVVTPGTLMEETMLESGRSNFLAALYVVKDRYGLAYLDLTTGEFRVTELTSPADLEMELNRLRPAECLLPESLLAIWRKGGFPADFPRCITWTGFDDWRFDIECARDDLQRHFRVASLDGFGCRGMSCAIGAAGAILHYAQGNLRHDASHLTTLSSYQPDDCLVLDRISQRNLELVDPIFADGKGNTLLAVLDETITPMGARLLREWVLRPLRDKSQIESRLDAVQDLLEQPMLLAELRETLSAVRDLERTVTRLSVGSSASARDLLVLRKGIEEVPGLKTLLGSGTHAALLQKSAGELNEMPELTALIAKAIVDEPPVAIRDGGMFRSGYNQELDVLQRASSEGKEWIANYQLKEQERTGIKSLRVRFNKVFGYYIEVTKSYLDMVPADYLRKQTIVNGERFITPELKEIEDKVLGADEKSKALEYELFQQMREEVVKRIAAIQQTARALAVVDCIASLAQVAAKYGYRRPEISLDRVLDIHDGRHPVLDAHAGDIAFVPNDCFLNTTTDQIALITGPNMAGKSTYIRQVALLVVMAQMGSFIPASRAVIGLADRIFTRVGAADDLSRGQSTFMVEMVETANILNHATPDSLIILDEIGRGTSTFDGLSLAWAIAEYLHDTPSAKARTLFATHYHELTALPLTKNGVKNYNVLVREQGEEIMFLRRIAPGAADKSYGIHVARLAGLPKCVIERAAEVLSNLENNEFEEDDSSRTARPKLAENRKTRKARKDDDENGRQLTLF